MKQLVVTCLPSFYKNLAFRQLATWSDLLVFYTNRSSIQREGDFFQYGIDPNRIIDNKTMLINVFKLYKVSKSADYIILGGWDDPYFWVLRFLVPRRKLKVIVESSIYEFKNSLVPNLIKYFFLRGVAECIVAGHPHERLVRMLGFKGEVKKSMGVGLLDFSYPQVTKPAPHKIANFLYIGRISKSKGVDLLFDFFVNRSDLVLNLVGTIESAEYIDKIEAMTNVNYLGYKRRNELKTIFDENDVFLLASRSEPWGLVVEEALYHGLPVLVSDKVGCNEDCVVNLRTGLVFETDNLNDFVLKMDTIMNIDYYKSILQKISEIDFEQKNSIYINSFV